MGLPNALQCVTVKRMSEKRKARYLDNSMSLRLDRELRQTLDELAKQDRRLLSDYVRLVLFRHVQDVYRASGKVFHEHTPVSGKRGK